jgi:hypothetical protein
MDAASESSVMAFKCSTGSGALSTAAKAASTWRSGAESDAKTCPSPSRRRVRLASGRPSLPKKDRLPAPTLSPGEYVADGLSGPHTVPPRPGSPLVLAAGLTRVPSTSANLLGAAHATLLCVPHPTVGAEVKQRQRCSPGRGENKQTTGGLPPTHRWPDRTCVRRRSCAGQGIFSCKWRRQPSLPGHYLARTSDGRNQGVSDISGARRTA